MQGRSTLELEREKFQANQQIERQKEQHELILKMVSVGDEKQARANLRFLAESRLLDEDLAKRVLSIQQAPVLPSSGIATRPNSRAFQQVRTDDEAIDLIIAWEGGYTAGSDPGGSGASNGGITLAALSNYLGRTATLDDLKNLSRSTIRDIYKSSVTAPAAGLTSPLVRAAYFNLAAWSGTRRAVTTLQIAAGRVLGKDIVPDGIVGAASIALINAVPDPDLLVETADCVQLESLKKNPFFDRFSKGWIERARAFSPVTLHGVCPELQPATVDAAAPDASAVPPPATGTPPATAP